MDVKDYSQKLDRAKERYSQAEKDLRDSYEKSTDDLKKTNESRTKELAKNYEDQKYKLEEQNEINNQNYSKQSQEELSKRQSDFRQEIKKNLDKFNQDRNDLKNKFNDKLTDISDSYDRSLKENDRYHQQAAKVMTDRYNGANKNYKETFEKELSSIEKNNRDQFKAQREENLKEKNSISKLHQDEIEKLRTKNAQERFKDIEQLKRNNEYQKDNFEKDKLSLAEQQNSRIDDILKTKNNEILESRKKFTDFQENLRQKGNHADEKFAQAQESETKALERKFNDEVRSIKRVADQKILGGTEVSNLKEQNKQLANAYESRLASTRAEAKKDSERSTFREETLDNSYRQQMKDVELAKSEALDKKEKELNNFYQRENQDLKDKSNSLVDHYKTETENTKSKAQDDHDNFKEKTSHRFVNQRIEFGKFINSMNDKKNEELSQIREDSTKDKSAFMEKAKLEFIDEKSKMKSDYTKQLVAKDNLYSLKLDQQEKETQKIIENYENRLNQFARKAEQEVEALKVAEEERKAKESTAFSLAFEAQNNDHRLEIENLRNKYESLISRDRANNDKNLSNIIQKYEDQIENERNRHNKELSTKVAEDQAQFQRLYKSTELEKATMRSQYEERIENLLAANQSNRSKKA